MVETNFNLDDKLHCSSTKQLNIQFTIETFLNIFLVFYLYLSLWYYTRRSSYIIIRFAFVVDRMIYVETTFGIIRFFIFESLSRIFMLMVKTTKLNRIYIFLYN